MASVSGSGGGGRGGGGGGGNGMFIRDVAWKCSSPVEENRNWTIYNSCGWLMKSGGISRFKHTHVIDEDDDADEEVYMYLIDMHSDERDGYQETVHALKTTKWERQQYETIMGSKRKIRGCHALMYWDKVTHVVSYFEPLYVVLRIMDSEVVPTMSFVYELMQVMKENLIRQQLKLCDMEAENDRVAKKNYLDLLDISIEVGEEEDNQLFQWVKPIHLDDEVDNPDP
ncbi:hypothetical protein CK203_045503 [Vitis vinifera]|uniref:Uncharacterized protein n=1 Tax=Vitis vinifera TaxID=29760 RepID=A0A438HXZ9_VITVI|nr:hypothetical protein CK203_045503 [Vitis vinifera]